MGDAAANGFHAEGQGANTWCLLESAGAECTEEAVHSHSLWTVRLASFLRGLFVISDHEDIPCPCLCRGFACE